LHHNVVVFLKLLTVNLSALWYTVYAIWKKIKEIYYMLEVFIEHSEQQLFYYKNTTT